jgi:hypothetical protein
MFIETYHLILHTASSVKFIGLSSNLTPVRYNLSSPSGVQRLLELSLSDLDFDVSGVGPSGMYC